jgi:D-erythronate 2-dehydrogenase
MKVLVTGAFGLVGSETVKQLTADGQEVVATDLDIPGNRKAAAKMPESVSVLYGDLTDPVAVSSLVSAVSPVAIIHLAAVIPPVCYIRPAVARKVNVGGTANLIAAAEQLPAPPRFVLASSIATYGPRNPYKITDLLSAATPVNPYDIYGAHKVEAEGLVRASKLDWAILRLGGVMTVNPTALMNLDSMYFEGVLPTDNRISTVDVRDVAWAFSAATTAAVVGETLLIGGDTSHRLRQGDIAAALAGAMGLVGGLAEGIPGDPDSDTAWFATDWMDTTRSQEALGFQHHSWPDMLAETARKAGPARHLIRLAAPLTHEFFKRRAPYYRSGNQYADPWGAVEAKWGDPRPEG